MTRRQPGLERRLPIDCAGRSQLAHRGTGQGTQAWLTAPLAARNSPRLNRAANWLPTTRPPRPQFGQRALAALAVQMVTTTAITAPMTPDPSSSFSVSSARRWQSDDRSPPQSDRPPLWEVAKAETKAEDASRVAAGLSCKTMNSPERDETDCASTAHRGGPEIRTVG